MEQPSMKKTGLSRINWKRLAMFGLPLLLFAVLITGGVFTAINAHAAGPNLNGGASKPGDPKNNDNSKPGDPKNNDNSKPGDPKNETITGTIVNIKGTTLIVRNFQDRGQTTVHVDRNTKISGKGVNHKNSFRDLKVGDFIQVTGPRNKDHDRSIQAKLIVVSKPPSHRS